MVPGSRSRSGVATPQGVSLLIARFIVGTSSTTCGAAFSGSAPCAASVIRIARRAATKPMSPLIRSVGTSAARAVDQSAKALTRAAASASRSSVSSPDATALTSAETSSSTVPSSELSPPTQIASAPPMTARTVAPSIPYRLVTAPISIPSVTTRPSKPSSVRSRSTRIRRLMVAGFTGS